MSSVPHQPSGIELVNQTPRNFNANSSLKLSELSERPRMCRICLEENTQDYVSPCMCAGSIGYVHSNCLRLYICRLLAQSEIKKPSDLKRIACEMCNRQIQFQYEIRAEVGCCCERLPRKSKVWILLLILMVFFAMLLGALLIVVFYYYTNPNGHSLFVDYEAGIWIIIGMSPLVAVALLLSIYYFVSEMMHGRVVITRILNRGQRLDRFKPPTMFDYDYYVMGE